MYREFTRWFAGPSVALFGVSWWENSDYWNWGCPVGESKLTFRRWVPRSDAGLDEISRVVSRGSYVIGDVAACQTSMGTGRSVIMEAAENIVRIYELAAWEYAGEPFPALPRLAGWKRHLKWFCECQEMLGVVPMLAAYAEGVPLEDIVLYDVEQMRHEYERDLFFSGSWDGDIASLITQFPHMRKGNVSGHAIFGD